MVDRNAQRLERAPRGVFVFAPLRRRHGTGHDIGQLKRCFNGGRLPRLHDLARDLPGKGFLAVIAQDAGQLFPALGVHEVGGGLALLAHPHVQRGVRPVRKAPGRVVQLVAGNAQVQQRAIDLLNAQLLQSLSGVAEVDLYHRGRQARQPRPGGLYRVRVLVQRDEPPALCAVQPEGDLPGVSRAARRAVQVNACRVDGKPVQALVQQHRDMLKRGRVKGLRVGLWFHRAQPPFKCLKIGMLSGWKRWNFAPFFRSH